VSAAGIKKEDAASATVSGDTHNALRFIRPVRCLVFFPGLSPEHFFQFHSNRQSVLYRQRPDFTVFDFPYLFEQVHDLLFKNEIFLADAWMTGIVFAENELADDSWGRVETRLSIDYPQYFYLPEIQIEHQFHKSSLCRCDSF